MSPAVNTVAQMNRATVNNFLPKNARKSPITMQTAPNM